MPGQKRSQNFSRISGGFIVSLWNVRKMMALDSMSVGEVIPK